MAGLLPVSRETATSSATRSAPPARISACWRTPGLAQFNAGAVEKAATAGIPVYRDLSQSRDRSIIIRRGVFNEFPLLPALCRVGYDAHGFRRPACIPG